MKTFTAIWTTVVCLLLFNGVGFADDTIKIGVIDFQQILNESATGKSVQDEINKIGQTFKTEIENTQSDIKAFQEKARREAPLLDEEQKKEIDRQMRTKLNELRILQEQHTKEFNTFRNEQLGNVKESVIRLAARIARDMGYQLIIEKQSGSVLYEDKAMQLTSQFIEALDQQKSTEEKKN
jgi:Skp family chaperone for outer membrane proteins